MIESSARDDWRLLGAKLRPFIARRVSPSEVDDVLQEVFLRMHKGLKTLQDEERFGAWVYQIARSAIVEHLRAMVRRPTPTQETQEEPAPRNEEDRAVASELAGYLAPFVAALPSPYRQAITLTELEGLTQKEAAQMMGVSLPGMKSRVQRGRAKLRELLEACCEIALDARGKVLSCDPKPGGLANCCPETLVQLSRRPPPTEEPEPSPLLPHH